MTAKRHAAADGHVGPFRWLNDTDDHGKRQAAYDFLFTFSSNYCFISFSFRDIDDVRYFFSLNNILAAADGHTATLTGACVRLPALDFLSILCSDYSSKRTTFELWSWDRRTDGQLVVRLMSPLWWRGIASSTTVSLCSISLVTAV